MQEMQEMQVWSLGQEDPLEKGMKPTLVFLLGESHGQRSLAVHRVTKSWTQLKRLSMHLWLYHNLASLATQLVKNLSAVQETWVHPLVGKIPWRREQLPTPVFWPREFPGLWGRKELDTTEWISLTLWILLVSQLFIFQ